MEKKFLSLLLVVAFLIAVVSPAFANAGGGKVRGDKTQGDSHQVQEMDPWPFEGE